MREETTRPYLTSQLAVLDQSIGHSAPIQLYPMVKRLIDLVLTVILVPIVLIVVGLLAAVVRTDGHPAFYRQPRLGRAGRTFHIWKLRTMVPDADALLNSYLNSDPLAKAEWDRTQKLRHDPRITPVGRLLRKYSLDELPQLWNVLLGEMSLVGPRPMFPEQRASYPGNDYFALRPGITGLWQVSVRNRSSFAERAVYDTAYAKNLSFLTDFRILLKTPLIMLRGTGV